METFRIVEKIKARVASGKPYIIGAAVGAIAAFGIGFNAGWIVTAGTVAQEVSKARMAVVASVCASQASAHWSAEGKQMDALEGWSNEAREELAQRFTPVVEDLPAEDIASACSRMLKPA